MECIVCGFSFEDEKKCPACGSEVKPEILELTPSSDEEIPDMEVTSLLNFAVAGLPDEKFGDHPTEPRKIPFGFEEAPVTIASKPIPYGISYAPILDD